MQQQTTTWSHLGVILGVILKIRDAAAAADADGAAAAAGDAVLLLCCYCCYQDDVQDDSQDDPQDHPQDDPQDDPAGISRVANRTNQTLARNLAAGGAF